MISHRKEVPIGLFLLSFPIINGCIDFSAAVDEKGVFDITLDGRDGIVFFSQFNISFIRHDIEIITVSAYSNRGPSLCRTDKPVVLLAEYG